MRIAETLSLLALLTEAIHASSIPKPDNALKALTARTPNVGAFVSPDHSLEKRKGGGGRGGGSSGGGGSRGGGSSAAPSRTGPSSFAGGSTRLGSGPTRSYGGGGYYGGGAAVPYTAGQANRRGLPAGALLLPAAIILLMPGLWLYGAYPYDFKNSYSFFNATPTQQFPIGTNVTMPVRCLCQEYSVCGCEENTDKQYIDDLVGNGSYAALNKSLINVAEVNRRQTLILNGTLPNGTTAPGGTDDSAAPRLSFGRHTGYLAMALVVFYGVML